MTKRGLFLYCQDTAALIKEHFSDITDQWRELQLREDTIFDDAKGTVGSLAFSDLDNDGWQEVWVPNYDKSTIELFKMSSIATETEFLQ